MKEVSRYRVRPLVGVVLAATASVVMSGCGPQPTPSVEPTTIVMDDFEDGDLAGWRSVGAGPGGWFVYTDSSKPPDAVVIDPGAPFTMPDRPKARTRRSPT